MAVRTIARVFPLLAALSLTACGGGTLASTTTVTTLVQESTTTSPAIPDPAFVPPECAGAAVTTVPLGTPTTTTIAPQALSLEEQTSVVTGIDNAVRDQYLYPDFNGTDWEGGAAALRAEVAQGLDTATFYEQIEDLITSLGDEHSDFETPAEVAATEVMLAATNDYVGIGVLAVPVPEENLVTVITVFPDSAAEHAGLEPHDGILAIDGIPIGEDDASSGVRVRGPECSLVVMSVRTPDEGERLISAVRFRVEGAIPIEARLVPTDDGRTIGYILVPTLLDGSIDDQVRAALDDFGPLDGLILDLRMNGGGTSAVLEPLLALFTSGTVGDFISRDGSRPFEIQADGVHNSQTVPLVVLIGDDTVSYAEVLAGTLGAVGRATLIGETTEGNVETLHGYGLPDGSMLWLANERFYPRADPDADWERDGIIPDVVVASDWQDFTFDTDPALGPALQALGQG